MHGLFAGWTIDVALRSRCCMAVIIALVDDGGMKRALASAAST
jgi:hypothetical protein